MFVVLVIQNRIAIQASPENLTNLPSERKCSIHHPICNIGLVLLMSIVGAISKRDGGFVRTIRQ